MGLTDYIVIRMVNLMLTIIAFVLLLIQFVVCLTNKYKIYDMERDSLVAINILNNDVLLNNKLVNNNSYAPILYYWNGETDIVKDLQSSESLCKKCSSLFDNPEQYLTISLSLFYFKYDENNEEQYEDVCRQIQDIIYLENFESDEIVNHFILKHFCYLYKTSIKEEYEYIENKDEIYNIINIYNKLKNKFKTRVSTETIINWVRSVLLEKDNFNAKNTNYIIDKLTKILKDDKNE